MSCPNTCLMNINHNFSRTIYFEFSYILEWWSPFYDSRFLGPCYEPDSHRNNGECLYVHFTVFPKKYFNIHTTNAGLIYLPRHEPRYRELSILKHTLVTCTTFVSYRFLFGRVTVPITTALIYLSLTALWRNTKTDKNTLCVFSGCKKC